MLNRYLIDLLLGFTIFLLAHNCLAAEARENEGKIHQFNLVKNQIYGDYLRNLNGDQYVVIIYNDFSLRYTKRDHLLKDLYEKILREHKNVFAIAYMNDTIPLKLGFIIVDKDFCPEVKSEINKLSISKINLSDPNYIQNFITAINNNISNTFVPMTQTIIVEDDSTLFTNQVNDCVAVTFQGISKITGKNAVQLAHYYRKQSIEEFFKASLDHFNPENTHVNIISNCYSEHLLNLITYLRKNGFEINGFYVPEIESYFMGEGANFCLSYCHPISMFEICQQSLVVGLHDAKLYLNYDKTIVEQCEQKRSSPNNISSKELIFGVAILAGIYYFFC
jgi:hypothetical protein